MPPSMLHEGLLLLFRNRPLLAPELLRDTLGVSLPAFTEARIDSAELTQVVPTEYRADLVVLLEHGEPVFAIVVEVQLKPDEDKRWTWPVYLTALRARLRCPAALMVVTADDAVARWASTRIETGHPGLALQPLVMGPHAVPVVTDADAAKRDPELAMLSVMAHGQEEVGVAVAKAALAAAPGLDEGRSKLYADLVFMSLGKATRAVLEALMQSGTYQYQSEFAKKYYGQGHHEGLEAGHLKEAREAVLDVLGARKLAVTAAARAAVEGCTDLEQLKAWHRRAVTAPSADAIFGATKKPSKAVAKGRKRR